MRGLERRADLEREVRSSGAFASLDEPAAAANPHCRDPTRAHRTMSPIELAAVLLGIANIVLLIRRSVWNYPFGLLMVLLYAHIFHGARLYSDALLQIFFFVVQIYGWLHWTRAKAEAGELLVRRLTARGRLLVGAASIGFILAWGTAMQRWTDASYPYWDASVAILSVAAQILLARRFFENWHLWILVDLLSIGLYAAKGLWLTMGLYALFLVLAAIGLFEWRRAHREAGPVVA